MCLLQYKFSDKVTVTFEHDRHNALLGVRLHMWKRIVEMLVFVPLKSY